MKISLLILWIFNFCDMIATLYFTSNGTMIEANPIMAILLHHPILFIFTKLIIATLICLYLYKNKQNKLVKLTTNICLIFYGILTLYYVLSFIYFA